MNNDMKKRLGNYINTDVIISIYSDESDPDKYVLGYILQMDDNYILINMINRYGEEDGFCIIHLDDVFIFDDDKIYSGKVLKLFNLKNQNRRYMEFPNNNVIQNLLKYAKDNKHLVEVNEDNSYIGFVTYFSDKTMELDLIDIYARRIGLACIDMSHIKKIELQSKYLNDLELLLQNHSNIK